MPTGIGLHATAQPGMADIIALGPPLLERQYVFAVPRDRVDRCFAHVERAGSLLVLGSSLTVMSGYRFVLRAAKLGIPVPVFSYPSTIAAAGSRMD